MVVEASTTTILANAVVVLLHDDEDDQQLSELINGEKEMSSFVLSYLIANEKRCNLMQQFGSIIILIVQLIERFSFW